MRGAPQTPYLLVDWAKMAAVAAKNGVALRPHVKTHRIPAIARTQVEAGATSITLAKVSEAEVMADAGLDDIFIAYPLVTETTIQRAIKLARTLKSFSVGVDSLEGARRLSTAAAGDGLELTVRLEVDTGLRGTGVPYDEALALARQIRALEGLYLTGIYTYRGAVLAGSPTLDLEAAGVEEGRLMASLADRIRADGIALESVSLGSTPTAQYAACVDGVTEIRSGTYVFYDRMQARLGACSLAECAAAVVVTVVSRPSSDLAIIDGGSKTFATDVQPGTQPLDLEGFGHVLEYPGATLQRLTEEHGMLALDADHDPKVGDTLHIIPNHVCSTVNLHDEIYLSDDDGPMEELRVAARGRVW